MSSCFQPFRYTSYTVCCVSKHKSQAREKKIPASVNLQSSIISQAEESSNSPDCKRNSFSNKSTRNSNAVGIIGGLMVDSTLNFVKKLTLQDEENGLPFVLCSDPILSKELLDLERSSFRFLSGKKEHARIDQSSIIQILRQKRMFLEKSGVSCIVMPCHISHCWHDEVAEGCTVPFLHMGECVAKELKEAKLRPLEAGSSPRIGVLTTNATLTARFYQEKLQNEGFEVILPDKATVEHTLIPAVEALSRKDIEGAQNLFRIALQVLLVRAVNTVVLASDDARELLPPNDPLWKKCIDPMDALTRSTVKYAQSSDGGLLGWSVLVGLFEPATPPMLPGRLVGPVLSAGFIPRVFFTASAAPDAIFAAPAAAPRARFMAPCAAPLPISAAPCAMFLTCVPVFKYRHVVINVGNYRRDYN